MSGDKALGKVLAILLYREKGMPGKSVNLYCGRKLGFGRRLA